MQRIRASNQAKNPFWNRRGVTGTAPKRDCAESQSQQREKRKALENSKPTVAGSIAAAGPADTAAVRKRARATPCAQFGTVSVGWPLAKKTKSKNSLNGANDATVRLLLEGSKFDNPGK